MCAALYKERRERQTEQETKVRNYNSTTNDYNVTLSEVMHFIDIEVAASTENVLGELKLLSFQEGRVQSAVRGIWCVTAVGKTSCISECH